MVKNVIWQFNGTLFDSDEATITSLHDALIELQIDEVELDPYYDYEQLKRVGLTELLHRTAAEFGLSLDQLNALFEQRLAVAFQNLPLRQDALQQLNSVQHFKGNNFLIANGPKHAIQNALQEQKIKGFFTDMIIDEQPLDQNHLQQNLLQLIDQNNLATNSTLVIFSDAISAHVVDQLNLNGYLLDVDGLLDSGHYSASLIHSLTELKLM